MDASIRLLGRMKGLVLSGMLALSVISYASAGESVTFLHNDVAGSPLLATDVNGLIAWKETYRPYGDRFLESPASTNNDLWFTGKSHDATTGLTYMGARYYDPVIGRFMGVDPAAIDLSNLHGINRFTYANNNPYKFVDPDGRLPVFLIPLLIKAIDIALTAYDVYTAAEEEGAAGVAKVAAENAVLSVVPGGKIADKAVETLRKARAARAANRVELPGLRRDGKVHGELPNEVPDEWRPEDLEELSEDLRESIRNRKNEQLRLGEDGPHRNRIREEEQLLRQIEKRQSGS